MFDKMTLFAFSIPMALYSTYVCAVPITIFLAMFGFRWKVGMWGNILSLGAVLFSFLLAIGWWENLAFLLAKNVPQLLFVGDCVAFFTIFVVSLLILDLATRSLSTVKVKYAEMVEKVGNGVALFLLSTALYSVYLFGSDDLGAVGEHHNVQLKEDSTVISALRFLSAGNLAGFTQVSQFDSTGDFRQLHLQRRQALMFKMLDRKDEGPIQGILGNDTLVTKIKWRE